MSTPSDKVEVEQAWAFGLKGDSAGFDEWLEKRSAAPYIQKLYNAFFTAKSHVSLDAEHGAAIAKFLAMGPVKGAKKLHTQLSAGNLQKLAKLIDALNVKVPGAANDLLPDVSLLLKNPQDELTTQRMKAYATLTQAATNLINFALNLATTAAATSDTKNQQDDDNEDSQDALVDLCALENTGVLAQFKRFCQNHCHKDIHQALVNKLKTITVRK